MIFIEEERICYLDSMRNSDNAKRYLHGALRWISDVATDLKKDNDLQRDVSIESWILQDSPVNLPQQKDAYACGVFVSAFANLLTDDIPLEKFHHRHENNFRRKLCLDILNQRLSYQDNPI